ncbi:MAG: exodeoxyribonuclease I [Pseudomonadales bacterium]|nr:exodeoxyribonuclease I [Pseudomonadales bacterium]
MAMESIYWHDYETTGTDPARDRAIQFAGIRTDHNLDPIGEPLNLLCRPGNDILPSPAAIAVTGIRMSDVVREGMTEAAFIGRILREFSVPGTCVCGFNSIRFDDEFTRHMLYRNFHDPYAREWQQGNSRWDVIDLFRMAYALRPDGMEWPTNDKGGPSFRLEALTLANGISHGSAHDALSDVLATVALTKKLKDAQPKLYDYLFALRDKKRVLQQLYPLGKFPLVHVSAMYPAERACTAVVLPLCSHPLNGNGVICYDLSMDPAPLVSCDAAELQRLVFTANEDLGEGEQRVALKTIHVNRAPAFYQTHAAD